jgi:hypothetical protein
VKTDESDSRFEDEILEAITEQGPTDCADRSGDTLVGMIYATANNLRVALGCLTANEGDDFETVRPYLADVLFRCARVLDACGIEVNRRAESAAPKASPAGEP